MSKHQHIVTLTAHMGPHDLVILQYEPVPRLSHPCQACRTTPRLLASIKEQGRTVIDIMLREVVHVHAAPHVLPDQQVRGLRF